LPLSSMATASPSIRQPAGSFAAALTKALNLSLQSLPLRVQAVATPSPTASSSRYPSYLYSCSQLLPVGTSSTSVASWLLERRRRLARLALGAPAFLAAAVGLPDIFAGRNLRHGPAGRDAGHAIVDQRIAVV